MENLTQGTGPSLRTLPWSVMERIYTVREDECGIQDIPSRNELDRQLEILATEKQIPDMYHLYRVADWWRAKLRANEGTKLLKQGEWRQIFHKAILVSEMMNPFVKEEWSGGQIFHASMRTQPCVSLPYAIGLKEIEECLTTCTQKWHQQRLTQETHRHYRRKLNATATEVHTCGQPNSQVKQWRKVFDVEQKRLMKLEAMNGPTTRRLYQSVTDAYFKHSRGAGDVDIQVMGDEVIQVMGGKCLKVLSNMREIEDDLIASDDSVVVGTDLATALVNRGLGGEIAIHKYEFKQDREHKKQVVEIRQVGTTELTHNDSDVPVKGLLVIVHLTGTDAHCFLVKTDVHRSRKDWWNKYTDEVVKELATEAHQRSWEIHATKEEK